MLDELTQARADAARSEASLQAAAEQKARDAVLQAQKVATVSLEVQLTLTISCPSSCFVVSDLRSVCAWLSAHRLLMVHQKEEMKAILAQHQVERERQQAVVEARASETEAMARETMIKHQVGAGPH